MTNIIPGATWRPINVKGRGARKRGRAYVSHIAVSNSKLLVPPSPTNPDGRGADWHLYLPKSGGIVQFIDLDLQSWSTYQGNGSVVASEAEGGVGDDVGAPWTPGQIEAQAFILAYLNETEGVPLDIMPDSRPGSRGYGWHRLGIDPWRVDGGEKWSSSRGKVCPGDARIAQAPIIVGRARELRGGSPMTPAPAPVPVQTPTIARPDVLKWPFSGNDYVGDINGPAASHGGYYAGERAFIKNVQQWLVYVGATPVDWRRWRESSWSDGKFELASVQAAERYFAGDRNPGRIYSDDYAQLTRVVR